MKRFKTLKEFLEYNGKLGRAAKAAGVFCPKCFYCDNGVLDEYCETETCSEADFEKEFFERYKNE